MKKIFLQILPVFAVAVGTAIAAPSVTTLAPANGSSVSSFTTLSVTFNEAVTGVGADDLSINSESAISVSGSGAGPYVFTFTQPPAGTVGVSWEPDHGITGIGTGEFLPPGGYAFTLTDTIAPTVGKIRTSQTTDGTIDDIAPTPGAGVIVLNRTDVTFSEPVTGMDATDLLVAGVPATAVSGSGAGPYSFTFPSQPNGAVAFTWAAGHGIVDAVGNAFAPSSWSVTVGVISSFRIREFLATNGTGLADENGEQNGWIELQNAGTGSVNLLGFSLTDDSATPRKWVLPSRTLASGAFIVIFASGKDRKPAAGNLHTNFKLGVSGGYIGLFGPSPHVTAAMSQYPLDYDGITVTTYPPQRTDYSYAQALGGGPAVYYLTPPTPGAENSPASLTGIAAAPTASVTRGFFKDPVSVVLSTATAGGTIRYTLDGSVPTAASTAYTAPISVSTTTVLRAATFATNFVPSATVTHSYIYLDNVFAQTSPPYDNPLNATDNANPQPPSVGGVPLPVHWGTASNFQNTAPATTGYVPFNNLPASNSVPADYGMDSKIVNDPNLYDDAGNISPSGQTNLQRMKESLRTLPILSVVMPSKDMFGPISDVPTALYPTSSAASKIDRTKVCSLELLLPDASTAFATTCGIDIHGNASRDPFKNPKHGFTLKFKGDYGPGTLDYELFPDSPVKSFDKLVLRADFNSSWRHQDVSTPTQRPKETRVRDAWSKDTFRAMGRTAGHHRYTNLFINGIYWGTYDLAEDEAEDFAASYFGGEKADYDVFDQGLLKNGTATAYYAMKATLGWTGATAATAPSAGVLATAFSNAEYETLKGQLDVPWFIDYMVQHYYIGHEDWGTTADYNKNWYVVRNAKAGGKFRFLPWDQENILYSETINRVTGALYPPVAAQTRLRTNAQFALDFADQVHKHMVSPDGALLPAANIARFNKWSSIMNAGAMALESARWGDYRMNVHNFQFAPYNIVYTWNGKWYSGGSTQTSSVNWLTEVSRLTNTYFPARTSNVLGQFRAAPPTPFLPLYPAVNAPEIRDNATNIVIASKTVSAGTVVKFTNVTTLPGGTTNAPTFYYTTNGVDPRVYYSGAISASAVSVAPNATLTINATTTLKVRALNGTTWSALNEQTFTVGTEALIPPVRITEIMYNPQGNTNDDAKEFIELRNTGTQPVDISNWFFGGVDCIIPAGTVLGPGDHFLIANNDSPSLFAATYPGATPGAYFGGSLDNGGERLALYDKNGRTIQSVDFHDNIPWSSGPDGGGYSLEIVNSDGDPDDAGNWRSSLLVGGTPGATNSTPFPAVFIISEFLIKPAGASSSFVEFQNVSGSTAFFTAATIRVNGVFAATLPDMFIPAGGFASTNIASLPDTSTNGGEISWIQGSHVAGSVRYGPQVTGYSFGKIGGNWVLTTPTSGAANIAASTAAQSNLKLNEWLANPRPGSDDWVELYNTHATLPVVLGGMYAGTSSQLFQYKSLAAIAPLGWARLYCNEGTNRPDAFDFDLPATSTTFTLRDSAAAVFENVALAAQSEDVANGRLPDGTATITALGYPSPGAANHAALTGVPRLNEIAVTHLTGDNAPWGQRPGWCELGNTTGTSISLGGWKLRSVPGVNGVVQTWTFPSGVNISSGGVLPVWMDSAAPGSTSAGLHLNSGFSLTPVVGLELLNPAGQIADRITWGWQIPELSFGRTGAGTWALLSAPTRGTANSAAAALGAQTAVRLNEWAVSTVELVNTSALPVSLGGMYLTDDPSELGRRKSRIPDNSFIAGNGFAYFIGTGGPTEGIGVNFTISTGSGESLRLALADDTLVDQISFGAFSTPAMGRSPDGTGPLATFGNSLGNPNQQGTTPWFLNGASNAVIHSGQIAQLSANFANTTSQQWYRNGALIFGATSSVYIASEDGVYHCVATGPGGSANSPAMTVTVLHTFATWTASHGIVGASASGDADGDGIANLAEFLANTNPTVPATAAERTAHQAAGTLELTSGVPTTQTLDFRLNRRAAFSGFGAEISADLGAWTPATPTLSELISTESNGDQHWRLKFAVPGGTPKRFLRLNIAQ